MDSAHRDPSDPDLTLIVPTHDRPDYLAAALRSVVKQDWDSWECIVVDDGSEPPVVLPVDDPRFRLIRHETASGPAGARNSGIRSARGRYIGFLDDDDLVSPSRVRVAVEALEDDRTANCHVGALVRDSVPEDVDVSQPGPVATEKRMRSRTPSVGQLTLRREIVKEFDTELRVGEDVEWWLRVEPDAVPIISERITYVVRLHPADRVGSSDRIRFEARLTAYHKNRKRMPRWGDRRARQLQRVAAAALAAGLSGRAIKYSAAALVTRPTSRRTKLVGRCLVSIVRRPRAPAAEDSYGIEPPE